MAKKQTGGFFSKVSRWLISEPNQKMLGFVGGGLAAAVGGMWAVYVHISDPVQASQEKSTPKIEASSPESKKSSEQAAPNNTSSCGGNIAIVGGDNNRTAQGCNTKINENPLNQPK
jgi:hypothetical protein